MATLEGNFVYNREDDFIYSHKEEFSWSQFKDMDARQIHNLFTKESGLIDTMTQYGRSNFPYSHLFRASLLLVPTPKLLVNVVEIVNIMAASDTDTQKAIADYLFIKAQTGEGNGQEYIPENISRLMVSIARPSEKDIIWDPLVGNGSLLINAVAFMDDTGNTSTKGRARHSCIACKGMELNLVLLRAAAMNTSLHGIKDMILEDFAAKNTQPIQQPTLILSNLLFTNESNITIEGNVPETGYPDKELELLHFIQENLAPGGRAVVLVPTAVLKSDIPAVLKTRQNLVNHMNLEGVINLPRKNNSLFSSAGILIFNKHEWANTRKVWFFKMDKESTKDGVDVVFNNPYQSEGPVSPQINEVNDVLTLWENREAMKNRPDSFFIPVADIKANAYNLSCNDYKLIAVQRETNPALTEDSAGTINSMLVTKKKNEDQFFEEGNLLREPKRKRKPSSLIWLLLLIATGTGFYFFKFKNMPVVFFNNAQYADSASNIQVSNSSMQPVSFAPDTISSSFSKTLKQIKKMRSGVEDLPSSSTDIKSPDRSSDLPNYSVVKKAWFYKTPDSTQQKNLYLQPRESLVLTPTDEKNGFIHVVYTNKKGQITRGWLNKKDLKPVDVDQLRVSTR